MPEYDLSKERVQVMGIGKVLDLDFARVMAKKRDLNLDDIITLDKVQKKKALTDSESKQLKRKG